MIKKRYKYFFIIFSLILLFTLSCERDASVSPPDEPPPKGKLVINSSPQGFSIILDGKERRRITPDSLTWLETGTYRVTLRKEFYFDSTITADVVDGEKTELFFNYFDNPIMFGSLQCNSITEESEIILNGERTGKKTPYKFTGLQPGYYEVRYEKENHRSKTKIYVVKSSQETISNFTLMDTTIWQEINTSNSPITSNNLTSIAIDHNDKIWIGTELSGLNMYSGSGWVSYLGSNSLIPSDQIRSISIDIENVKWIGTGDGLWELGDTYDIPYSPKNSNLPDYNIRYVFCDELKFTWVCTETSFSKTYFDPVEMRRVWLHIFEEGKNNLPENNYTTAVSSVKTGVLAGLKTSGIIKEESLSWRLLRISNANFPTNNISCSTLDKDNNAWFGHNPIITVPGGLSKYDGKTWSSFRFPNVTTKINTLFISNSEIKWVGTNEGVIYFSDFSNRSTLSEETVGVPLNDVIGIIEDASGNIWFATKSQGIYILRAGNY